MAWTKRMTTQDGQPRYKVYYYTADGVQHSKTFKRYEDARRFRSGVEVRVDEGTYLDPSRGKMPVATFAKHFLASRSLAPATAALYEMELRVHILPALGSEQLASVTKDDVRAFLAGLEKDGKGRATISAVHRLLHGLFAAAVDDDRIGRNPAHLKRGEVPKAEARAARFLTDAEVRRIAEQVPPRYRALVWTLALSGLRVGEATALRLEHLDLPRREGKWQAGTISVKVNAPEVNGRKLLDQPTKTERSVRTVDIPAPLVAMLAEHVRSHVGNRFDGKSLVFTNRRGTAVAQSNFRKNIFQPAARRAKVEPLPRVHDLRHSAASFMGAAGYTLLEAAGQLGHAATSMTEHYSHVYPELRQGKVGKLDALLGG